jgi:hypothetical protein
MARRTDGVRPVDRRAPSKNPPRHPTQPRLLGQHGPPIKRVAHSNGARGNGCPADDVGWDMSVCHTWYWVDYGFQANRGSILFTREILHHPILGASPFCACPDCGRR